MPGHAIGSDSPNVSIVVPIADGARLVESLRQSLTTLMDGAFPRCELILVDDGSTDGTWEQLLRAVDCDRRITAVRLRSRVGQTGALCAGFSVASGEVVVTMDDDMESDPREAVRFVEAVRAGAEFASGWRRGRRGPVRSAGSWLYNLRLRRSWGLPFHDAGCGFNALSSDLAKRLSDAGWEVRQHRIKPVIALMTDRIVEVRIEVRRTTTSHHSIRTLAASWLDVELTFGRLTPRGFAAGAIVTPVLATAVVGVRRFRRTFEGAGELVFAVIALGIGAFSFDVLRRTLVQERKVRELPPFEVLELVRGSGLPGPPDAPSEEFCPRPRGE